MIVQQQIPCTIGLDRRAVALPMCATVAAVSGCHQLRTRRTIDAWRVVEYELRPPLLAVWPHTVNEAVCSRLLSLRMAWHSKKHSRHQPRNHAVTLRDCVSAQQPNLLSWCAVAENVIPAVADSRAERWRSTRGPDRERRGANGQISFCCAHPVSGLPT